MGVFLLGKTKTLKKSNTKFLATFIRNFLSIFFVCFPTDLCVANPASSSTFVDFLCFSIHFDYLLSPRPMSKLCLLFLTHSLFSHDFKSFFLYICLELWRWCHDFKHVNLSLTFSLSPPCLSGTLSLSLPLVVLRVSSLSRRVSRNFLFSTLLFFLFIFFQFLYSSSIFLQFLFLLLSFFFSIFSTIF